MKRKWYAVLMEMEALAQRKKIKFSKSLDMSFTRTGDGKNINDIAANMEYFAWIKTWSILTQKKLAEEETKLHMCYIGVKKMYAPYICHTHTHTHMLVEIEKKNTDKFVILPSINFFFCCFLCGWREVEETEDRGYGWAKIRNDY